MEKLISVVQASRKSKLGQKGLIVTPVVVSRQTVSCLVAFADAPQIATLIDCHDVYRGTQGSVQIADHVFYNVCGCCRAPRAKRLPSEYQKVITLFGEKIECDEELARHYNKMYANGLRRAIVRSGIKTCAVRKAEIFIKKFGNVGAEIGEFNTFRTHLTQELAGSKITELFSNLSSSSDSLS